MAPTGPPPGHYGLKNSGHHPSLPPPHSHGGGHYSAGPHSGLNVGVGGPNPRGFAPSGPPPPAAGALNPALGALLQSLAGPLAALTAGNPQQTALLAQLGLGMNNNNLNNNLNNNNNMHHAAALFGRGGAGVLGGAVPAGPNLLGAGPGAAGGPLGSLGALGQFGGVGGGVGGGGGLLGAGLGASPGAASPSGVVLLVSNMPDGPVTTDDLFTLFGVYGDVVRVKILYNKKDNALVQMADGTQECVVCMNCLQRVEEFHYAPILCRISFLSTT